MIKSVGKVDITKVSKWLIGIPFEVWPQQHKLADDMIRPAMVTDPSWNNFADTIKPIEDEVVFKHFPELKITWRALSVVMPGHAIPTHRDQQPDHWKFRVHIPIQTSKNALFVYEDLVYRLEASFIYPVDTRNWHSCINGGTAPRIHLMLDLCG